MSGSSDTGGWIAAGLLDPSSPCADERIELLDWLTARGLTIEQMAEANGRGQLIVAAADLDLRSGPRCSARVAAERIGATVEAIMETRRASGLPPVEPDDPVFTEGDVTMMQAFEHASTLFSREELTHLSRVIGSAMRRIADAASEMFLLDVEAPLVAKGTREVNLARSSFSGMQMAATAIAVFDPMFRAHLEASVQMSRAARAETHELATVPLAVGFVDLTGYTERSGHLDPASLLELVLTFEARASELVTDHGGRVVKLIGDEVMFSAVSAEAACAIALDLLEAMASTDTSAPRGGVAYGDVVAHGGDLYGDAVNLASRMAGTAVPGEVLVDAEVIERDDVHPFAPAGRRLLKGFSEPIPLWSLTLP